MARAGQGVHGPVNCELTIIKVVLTDVQVHLPHSSADEARAVAWVKRASLQVSSLNDDAVVTRVLDALASRMDGQQAAPDYYARRLRVTRTCLTFAVRKKRLPKNPLLSANLPEHWTLPKLMTLLTPGQSEARSSSPTC